MKSYFEWLTERTDLDKVDLFNRVFKYFQKELLEYVLNVFNKNLNSERLDKITIIIPKEITETDHDLKVLVIQGFDLDNKNTKASYSVGTYSMIIYDNNYKISNAYIKMLKIGNSLDFDVIYPVKQFPIDIKNSFIHELVHFYDDVRSNSKLLNINTDKMLTDLYKTNPTLNTDIAHILYVSKDYELNAHITAALHDLLDNLNKSDYAFQTGFIDEKEYRTDLKNIIGDFETFKRKFGMSIYKSFTPETKQRFLKRIYELYTKLRDRYKSVL